MTRQSLAQIVHDRLGEIATDRGWSYTTSGDLTEGDYTYAIDAALRDLELLDSDDEPDITEAEVGQYNTLVEVVERYMLAKAERSLAMRVDLQLGPRRESFSQQAEALRAMNQAGGSRRVVAMRLHHERFDYPRSDDVDASEAVDDEWE